MDVPEAAPTAARTGRAYLNMPDIVDGVGKGLTVASRSGQLCVAKMQQTDWTAEADDGDGVEMAMPTGGRTLGTGNNGIWVAREVCRAPW